MDFRVSLLILVIFVLLYGIKYGDAVRCFQCHNLVDPTNCNNIVTCSSTEYCYSEQVINSTGSILYNTGCRVKEHCGTTSGVLMGRRMIPSYHGNMSDVNKRRADISTCIKCCNHDTCNNQGCGIQATNIQQRGPYCYTCNATSHPSLCKTATICGQDEMCFVYIPSDYYLSTVPMYRSQCISKAACAVISQAVFNPNCPPKCCDNDYCNDDCGSTHSTTPFIATATSGKTPITYMSTTSTAVPTTTTLSTKATTARPTTTSTTLKTTAIPQTIDTGCTTDHYYDVITGLCIKIIENQQLSYHDAKQACENIGERLVTIDSHEKTTFIDYTLLHHSSIHQLENRKYWTSAYDLHNNSKYFWLNGAQMHYTNWGGGDEVAHNQQPDDLHEKNQDCVVLYGLDGYRWHDTLCQYTEYYICENPNTLLHMGTPSKDNSCKAGHFYDSYTGLCIKLFETTQLTYNGAKAACEHFGDKLVTIDTHEKTIFIDNLLIHQSIVPEEDQRVYWIGAYDVHSNKVFYWPNGHKMHYTNWGGGDEVAHNQQPDSDRHQNCVVIYGRDHYRWHDDNCIRKQYYICEYTKSTPHREVIVPSTTVSQHQTTTLTVAPTLFGTHGPLCYTCNNMNQPNECTNYTQCKTNEVCMVHLSASLSIASGHNAYSSKCELLSTCNLIASLEHNQHCHTTCCSSDLCNDKCSQPLKQVTTATPTTTTARPTTTTTKAPAPSSGQCPTSSGWQTLHTGSTTMCIKIYTETKNWEAARQTCQGDHNGDLVVMDTKDKMSLIRSWLTNHGQYSNVYGFWFGAYDKERNNHFVWVKSNTAVRDGDWDNGQPNHVDGGHDQNCGIMWNQSTQRFQWHDDYCAFEFPFVCEL